MNKYCYDKLADRCADFQSMKIVSQRGLQEVSEWLRRHQCAVWLIIGRLWFYGFSVWCRRKDDHECFASRAQERAEVVQWAANFRLRSGDRSGEQGSGHGLCNPTPSPRSSPSESLWRPHHQDYIDLPATAGDFYFNSWSCSHWYPALSCIDIRAVGFATTSCTFTAPVSSRWVGRFLIPLGTDNGIQRKNNRVCHGWDRNPLQDWC